MLSNHCHRRRSLAKWLLCLTLLAGASKVSAVPVTTYRDRVHRTLITLKSLHAAVMNGDASVTLGEDRIDQAFQEVRSLLPPTETVESNGSSLKVDNAWLDETLTQYKDSSASDEDRKHLLTEAIERLGAMDEALAELSKLETAKADNRNKDESRVHLSNILRREEYAKKSVEGNALTRLWERFVTWLRSLFPNTPEIEPQRAAFLSKVAQVLVVALAVALIAYVLWKFWPRIWKSNPKSRKTGKREARVVLGERLEANQSSADLLAEAEKLAREGQLRAAIRKGYIAFLCELGDRKVLGLAVHKTNRDYLRSVRNHQQLYSEMQVLTRSFENHWYGFETANIEDWNMFRARYQQALKQ